MVGMIVAYVTCTVSILVSHPAFDLSSIMLSLHGLVSSSSWSVLVGDCRPTSQLYFLINVSAASKLSWRLPLPLSTARADARRGDKEH